MAAPAAGFNTTTTTTTTEGQDEAVVNTTMMPLLPRAIQLVLAIDWRPSSTSSTTTTTASSMNTIGDVLGLHRRHDDRCFVMWMGLVCLPSIFILCAAGMALVILHAVDDGGGRNKVDISSAGGFCFLVIPVLLFVYMAVLLASRSHLALFVPRTPYAACKAFDKGTWYEGFCQIILFTSLVVWLLKWIDQAWPLLVVWTCLLGLLVASVVAFWLCLRRTYYGDDGGELRGNSSCGERVVIDGFAYFYVRRFYEYVVRVHEVTGAGTQQLDADVPAATSLV